MTLTSDKFGDNQFIIDTYTCEGKNINPPLTIEDVPEDAKSLALIVDDPDAPGGTFTHWVVWNIDPATTFIREGSVPPGAVQGKNSAGNTGYTGPCPPQRQIHHYIFKLYALGNRLDLPEGSDKLAVENAMSMHIVANDELRGQYGRQA